MTNTDAAPARPTARAIREAIVAAFAGTDVADEVRTGLVVDTDPLGYRARVEGRALAFRVARHILDAYAADPEAGYVCVNVDRLGVLVTYDR